MAIIPLSRRGYTLIEILVAISLVAMLVAFGFRAVGGIQARATPAKCLGNLRQIGVGLQAYLADHDQRMPMLAAGRRSTEESELDTIDTVLASYVGDPAAFRCPADTTLWQSSGTSYYWNVVLNGQMAHNLNFLEIADTPTRIPVLSDKEGWHRKTSSRVNFLYADGHARSDLRLFTD